MYELWKNSAVIAKRNVDSNQNPISVKLTELKQIIDVHSCVVLNQLPDENYGVNIDGFTEVYDIEDVTTRSFKVDYANGVIYFHPYNIGKNIVSEYMGIGSYLLSASRIYTKYDKHGNVLESLEELLDKSKLYIEAIESMYGAVEVINKLDEDIVIGTTLHEDLIKYLNVTKGGMIKKITSSQFTKRSDGYYQFKINHNLNSDCIVVTLIDTDIKEELVSTVIYDDNNNLTVLTDKQRNVTVVMNVMGGLDSKAEILQLKQEVAELRAIIEGINK